MPDLNYPEEWVVKTSLQEHDQHPVERQYADSMIRLSAWDRQRMPCPVISWQIDSTAAISSFSRLGA